MRVPITLDLHVGNFTYPDTPNADQLFDKLVAIAETCEKSGFGSISLMDHLHQIGPIGPPDHWMFEGSTMLAAIAARTETLTLGLVVGSVTYRNPALMAKITTTLDVISKGRAWQGVGAGWFEEEHTAYGFEFPPLKTRFEMLEEALQIYKLMFGDGTGSFHGEHFRIEDPYNNPKPIRGDIPILIGGSGEKKTLRLVAKYGDGCNLFGDPETITHKLGVLRQHCETEGRDYDEITKTAMARVLIAPTHEEAQAKLKVLLSMGFPPAVTAGVITGDPDTVGERVQAIAELGIEGLTVTMPDHYDLAALDLAGRTIGPIFAGAKA